MEKCNENKLVDIHKTGKNEKNKNTAEAPYIPYT